MAEKPTTRQRILQAAYGLFYSDGFARVGVDAIAAAAGVTKRTLYYHFESKDELMAEVLEWQQRLALERIRDWTQQGAATPQDLVARVFRDLETWAEEPGFQGSGFTRAAMELAGLPGHPARAAASKHKAEIETWLTRAFSDFGPRRPPGRPAPPRRPRPAKAEKVGERAAENFHGARFPIPRRRIATREPPLFAGPGSIVVISGRLCERADLRR